MLKKSERAYTNIELSFRLYEKVIFEEMAIKFNYAFALTYGTLGYGLESNSINI